jgi:hypothetical protein
MRSTNSNTFCVMIIYCTKNKSTKQESCEVMLDASKKVDLEVNAEKTK